MRPGGFHPPRRVLPASEHQPAAQSTKAAGLKPPVASAATLKKPAEGKPPVKKAAAGAAAAGAVGMTMNGQSALQRFTPVETDIITASNTIPTPPTQQQQRSKKATIATAAGKRRKRGATLELCDAAAPDVPDKDDAEPQFVFKLKRSKHSKLPSEDSPSAVELPVVPPGSGSSLMEGKQLLPQASAFIATLSTAFPSLDEDSNDCILRAQMGVKWTGMADLELTIIGPSRMSISDGSVVTPPLELLTLFCSGPLPALRRASPLLQPQCVVRAPAITVSDSLPDAPTAAASPAPSSSDALMAVLASLPLLLASDDEAVAAWSCNKQVQQAEVRAWATAGSLPRVVPIL